MGAEWGLAFFKTKVLKYYLNTIYTINNMLIVMAFKKHKEKKYTMFMSTYNTDDKMQYKMMK